jgi:NO-binding membrane sensor protein with MHYT domain
MSDTAVALEQHWRWGYIVGSFFVGVVGSGTALLIMRQRTAAGGLLSWAYLAAASVVFGAVGVWSLHFTGINALQLIDPSTGSPITVAYSASLTGISLMVVIVIAFIGFSVVADPKRQEWWRYAVTSLAGAGGALTMHYVGMEALRAQAVIIFNPGLVVCSVFIGIAVLGVGLLLFFRFRSLWQHNNSRLLLCSLVLAAGVCAIHYTGQASATYHLTSAPPSDLSSGPTPDTLLTVTLSLAGCACLAVLISLALQYRRLLRRENAKLRTLMLNAVIVHGTTNQLLGTLADGLPSVIIESAYQGVGAFDRTNRDFLRMFKSAAQWSAEQQHTAFLQSMRDNKSLSAYSLQLHEKFISAAHELAAACQLSLPELGLLYWQPTGSMVSVVMVVDDATAERITRTSSFRFVTQPTVYPFLAANMCGDVPPEHWLHDVMDYYTKSSSPMQPPLPQQPQQQGEKGREFHRQQSLVAPVDSARRVFKLLHSSSSVAPAPPVPCLHHTDHKPAEAGACPAALPPSTPSAAAESVQGGQLYLGLYYVKVTPGGLLVMLMSAGPYYHVPMVPLGEPTADSSVPTLSAEQLSWLQEQHRAAHAAAAAAADDSKGKRTQSHQVSATVSTGNLGLALNTHRLLVSRSSRPSDTREQDAQLDLPGSAEQLSREEQKAAEIRAAAATAASRPSPELLSVEEEARKEKSEREAAELKLPSASLLRFQAAYHEACVALAALVGTRTDCTAAALAVELVPINSCDALLAFTVCRMSSRVDTGYLTDRLTFVPMPVFDILHYARSESSRESGWTRRLIRGKKVSLQAAAAVGPVAGRRERLASFSENDHQLTVDDLVPRRAAGSLSARGSDSSISRAAGELLARERRLKQNGSQPAAQRLPSAV